MMSALARQGEKCLSFMGRMGRCLVLIPALYTAFPGMCWCSHRSPQLGFSTGSPNTLVRNRTGSIIPLQSVFRMPGLIGRHWDLHPQLEFYCSSQLNMMLKSLGRTCAVSSVWSPVLAGHFQGPTAPGPQPLAGKVHGYCCSRFAFISCRLWFNRIYFAHVQLELLAAHNAAWSWGSQVQP